MSKTVYISSANQFNELLQKSTIVVADFYADWCGPCKAISPLFEQLSAQLSRPQKVTFVKVNTEKQQEISNKFGVTTLPTFIIFKNDKISSSIRGADPTKLSEAVKALATEVGSDTPDGWRSSDSRWVGSDLPRGFTDVTDEVDIQGLDLLNANSDLGGPRTLFDASKPSDLSDKRPSREKPVKADWVESDTDEQLMLFVPFRATLKVHTIQITSLLRDTLPVDDESPMRPRTIRLYTNRAQVLGFEEAEDIPATQEIMLDHEDWNEKSGTARIELRFVKFQNVTSIVIFVVDGDGKADKVRVDRIRIVGEAGEKRELGKLEKVSGE